MACYVAARITEVSNRDSHFSAGEVHGHAALVEERLRQAHFEPLSGPLALLTTHIQLPQLCMVEASVQEVEAISVTIAGVAEGLAVAQGSTVKAIERREAVRVQTAHVTGVAH